MGHGETGAHQTDRHVVYPRVKLTPVHLTSASQSSPSSAASLALAFPPVNGMRRRIYPGLQQLSIFIHFHPILGLGRRSESVDRRRPHEQAVDLAGPKDEGVAH